MRVVKANDVPDAAETRKVSQLINFSYLCFVERKIKTYGGYFESFKASLTAKEQDKIDYGLLILKTRDRISKKFVEHVKDSLYELRIEYNSNIYRVFFIFDEGSIIVLFNGFQKKTQKTPPNEIEKALRIKEEYYADKQSQNR
jgi:phage-related protein